MPAEKIQEKLDEVLRIMKNAVEEPIRHPKKSIGGLIGGEAKLVQIMREVLLPCAGRPFPGRLLQYGSAGSQCVHGAHCGGATAGSAGVLPGVLLAVRDTKQVMMKCCAEVF